MDTTTVLVITEDKAIRETTVAALAEGGYVVLETGPGSAVKRSDKTKPHLVLLDKRAASEDWNLINEVTRDHAIPLVLIAQRGSRDVALAFQTGAADCITDPFEDPETLARVGNSLQNKLPQL